MDDRRHDRISHLAVALSVNDLLSEVSKLVGAKVPVAEASILAKRSYSTIILAVHW